MRILLVSSGSGSRGGGEIFLDYLGKGLADRGHQVLVWIPAHPRMDELAVKCARFARVTRRNTATLTITRPVRLRLLAIGTYRAVLHANGGR